MIDDGVKKIKGGVANDFRGQIKFVNEFDMNEVRRFYIIKNTDRSIVRGWRGHKIEKRWFYVLRGSFQLDLVKIDDWSRPNPKLVVERLIISENDQTLLAVPEGYATAFASYEDDSELLVYANSTIDDAIHDDHTWPITYFKNRIK